MKGIYNRKTRSKLYQQRMIRSKLSYLQRCNPKIHFRKVLREERGEEILVTQVKGVLGKPPRCPMQLDPLRFDFTLQDQQAKPC